MLANPNNPPCTKEQASPLVAIITINNHHARVFGRYSVIKGIENTHQAMTTRPTLIRNDELILSST
jgi:hypothetical protein